MPGTYKTINWSVTLEQRGLRSYGFFFQICEVAGWLSSIRGLNQIWIKVGEENRET